MFKASKEKLLNNFIEKCMKIHGDKYDYSLVKYTNNKTKVKIICKEHGIFEQRPDCHTHQGCPRCSGNVKITNNEFILRANQKHQSKYDYSLTNYKNNSTKVKIICQQHGIFEQSPKDHIRGIGCWKCKKNYPLTQYDFLSKAKEIHGDNYDYSKSEYISALTKLTIICKRHGEFKQTPNKHLTLEQGCPRCKKSKKMNEICLILEKNNIYYENEKTIKGCVSKNNKLLYFDIFIESKNLAIEYDGEQHFRPVENWGGEKSLKEVKERDAIKNQFCKNNNIELIRISYSEKIEERMKEIISQYLS